MRPEHIRLQDTERIFSEKNLLHAQLNIIALMKRYESYKELRAQELVLKIALKTKLAETKDSLALLDKLLPKPTISQKTAKKTAEAEHFFTVHKKKLTLEAEVDEIRRKLAALQ
jgi:hypothetical protein